MFTKVQNSFSTSLMFFNSNFMFCILFDILIPNYFPWNYLIIEDFLSIFNIRVFLCCTVSIFHSFQMVHRVLIVTKFVLYITNKPVPIVFYISCYHGVLLILKSDELAVNSVTGISHLMIVKASSLVGRSAI